MLYSDMILHASIVTSVIFSLQLERDALELLSERLRFVGSLAERSSESSGGHLYTQGETEQLIE
jgi:hypothetical protein